MELELPFLAVGAFLRLLFDVLEVLAGLGDFFFGFCLLLVVVSLSLDFLAVWLLLLRLLGFLVLELEFVFDFDLDRDFFFLVDGIVLKKYEYNQMTIDCND